MSKLSNLYIHYRNLNSCFFTPFVINSGTKVLVSYVSPSMKWEERIVFNVFWKSILSHLLYSYSAKYFFILFVPHQTYELDCIGINPQTLPNAAKTKQEKEQCLCQSYERVFSSVPFSISKTIRVNTNI